MLINARPRIVSHGFETFVPIQRVESLHQRLVEMTNNDVNAWNFFRPVATPTNGWDDSLDDFNNNENFPLHTLYAGYYQDTSLDHPPQASNLPKTPLYTTGHQLQCNTQRTTSDSHSMHQRQAAGLDCMETGSPMLGNGYSHGYLGQRHASFVDFSNTKNVAKNFPYQVSNESDLTPFASALSLAPQGSYQEDVSMITDYNVDTTSPSTAYSGYSSTSAAVDPVSLMSVNVTHHQDTSVKPAWWQDNSRNSQSEYPDTYGMAMPHDGLPTQPKPQIQQYTDTWSGSGYTAGWPPQPRGTISPKALTLSVPPVPYSSSGSSPGLMLSMSDSSSAASSSREDTPGSGPETFSVVEPPTPVRQQRQILPDSLPRSRIVPMLPSNDFASRKPTQKRPLKSKSESHSRRKPSPPYQSKSFITRTSSHKVELLPTKSFAPKRIEPKPTNTASWSDSSYTSATAQATHHRVAKDDFLVRSKLAGMSYKDIRRKGDFVEAESTLRGRFRTLTKNKAARVRKPEWTDNDVRLLKRAVRKLTSGSDALKNKVPWKQVAEYIANNGGSYHFGNATCRKRWDELPSKHRS